MPAGP